MVSDHPCDILKNLGVDEFVVRYRAKVKRSSNIRQEAEIRFID